MRKATCSGTGVHLTPAIRRAVMHRELPLGAVQGGVARDRMTAIDEAQVFPATGIPGAIQNPCTNVISDRPRRRNP